MVIRESNFNSSHAISEGVSALIEPSPKYEKRRMGQEKSEEYPS
jgi:hypothetical protein